MLDIAINEKNVLSVFERQTLPFHFSVEQNGTEQNDKNAFIPAPSKVIERFRTVQLVNAV